METKQITKECTNGTYAVFTSIKVRFGKLELIHSCVKKHQYANKYIEPKSASEVIKWAKETYNSIGRNDVIV